MGSSKGEDPGYAIALEITRKFLHSILPQNIMHECNLAITCPVGLEVILLVVTVNALALNMLVVGCAPKFTLIY